VLTSLRRLRSLAANPPFLGETGARKRWADLLAVDVGRRPQQRPAQMQNGAVRGVPVPVSVRVLPFSILWRADVAAPVLTTEEEVKKGKGGQVVQEVQASEGKKKEFPSNF